MGGTTFMRIKSSLVVLLFVFIFLIIGTICFAQDSPGLPAPHDDVQKVFANFDILEEVLEKIND